MVFGAAPGTSGQYVFSAVFGGGDTPWIGSFPANYNPTNLVQGSTYTLPTSTSYDVQLTVQVNGQMVAGLLTLLSPQLEQLAPSVQYTAPQPLAGSHVGFYTYMVSSVSLTSLTVE